MYLCMYVVVLPHPLGQVVQLQGWDGQVSCMYLCMYVVALPHPLGQAVQLQRQRGYKVVTGRLVVCIDVCM